MNLHRPLHMRRCVLERIALGLSMRQVNGQLTADTKRRDRDACFGVVRHGHLCGLCAIVLRCIRIVCIHVVLVVCFFIPAPRVILWLHNRWWQ